MFCRMAMCCKCYFKSIFDASHNLQASYCSNPFRPHKWLLGYKGICTLLVNLTLLILIIFKNSCRSWPLELCSAGKPHTPMTSAEVASGLLWSGLVSATSCLQFFHGVFFLQLKACKACKNGNRHTTASRKYNVLPARTSELDPKCNGWQDYAHEQAYLHMLEIPKDCLKKYGPT